MTTANRPFRAVFDHGWIFVVTPVAIALVGALWIEIALRHFERVEGHERKGIIGFHYSTPEWGFDYRKNGRHIEKFAFDLPETVILAALLVSAAAGSWRKRREFGVWGIVGFCAIHLFAALAFVAVAVLLWFEAADVFI